MPSSARSLARASSIELDRAMPLDEATSGSRRMPLASVVQVFTTHAFPDYSLPWQVCPQVASTGSGFAFRDAETGRRLILTNAHVAAGSNAILRVQLHGSPDKIPAKVVAIGNDCDLAILTLHSGPDPEPEDDADLPAEEALFWQSVQPADIAPELPQLYEEVHVVGFPGQFSSICVTAGIISRICVQTYNTTAPCSLLTIQIDAAINPGNSGGPAFDQDGQLIGVAFLKSTGHDVDNTGYLIPCPIIENFLRRSLSEEGFHGMPCLPFRVQSLENKAFRASLQMDRENRGHSGLYIKEVAKLGALAKLFKEGDVILQVNGKVIGNDMTVKTRGTETIDYSHLITAGPAGATTTLKLLRAGKEVVSRRVVVGLLRSVH